MKKLRVVIKKANLPYKKEINKILIYNLLVFIFFLSLFWIFKNAMLFVFCFFWLAILNIILFNRYKNLGINYDNKIKEIFINNFLDFDGKTKVDFKKRIENTINDLKNSSLVDSKLIEKEELKNVETLENCLSFASLFHSYEIEEFLSNSFLLMNKFENITLMNNLILFEKIKSSKSVVRNDTSTMNNVLIIIGISVLVLILTISGIKILL